LPSTARKFVLDSLPLPLPLPTDLLNTLFHLDKLGVDGEGRGDEAGET
jgi:hypothetical protein